MIMWRSDWLSGLKSQQGFIKLSLCAQFRT